MGPHPGGSVKKTWQQEEAWIAGCLDRERMIEAYLLRLQVALVDADKIQCAVIVAKAREEILAMPRPHDMTKKVA